MPSHLDRARSSVLDWLRSDHRDPNFLKTVSESELAEKHEIINQRFLKWARTADFECVIVPVESTGKPAFEVHWTHRGSSFVGFKQPPPESTAEDALLAGCAALLQNEWCRERLPE